jgi:hypothetical protein
MTCMYTLRYNDGDENTTYRIVLLSPIALPAVIR